MTTESNEAVRYRLGQRVRVLGSAGERRTGIIVDIDEQLKTVILAAYGNHYTYRLEDIECAV